MYFNTEFPDPKAEVEEVGILIVGAGMTGISTADRLNRFGITDFLILEGGDTIGGRLKSQRIHAEDPEYDIDVELGANWIHGTVGNYLTHLAEQYNVTGNLIDLDDIIVYDERELLYDSNLSNNSSYAFDRYVELSAQLNTAHKQFTKLSKEYTYTRQPDISIGAALRMFGWEEDSDLTQLLTWKKYDYDYADTPETLSLKNNVPLDSYKHFTKSDLMVNGGEWHRILDGIIQEGEGFGSKIRLNQTVVDIVVDDEQSFFQSWRKLFGNDMEMKEKRIEVRSVEKLTGLTKIYKANRVVVATSIGALQHSNAGMFPNPPLPDWKRKEIAKFRMSVYMKIFLVFDEQFWPDNEFLMYADNRRGYFPRWCNMNHPKRLGKKHPLKVWMVTVTGNEAKRLERMSNDQIQTEVVAVYRKFLKNESLPLPKQIVVPRWYTDPLFRGSYSMWPLGTTWKDHQKLCKPVFESGVQTDLVWFAGEYCHDIYDGYLHGAVLSGNETATMLRNCLANRSKCPSNAVSLIWLSCFTVGILTGIVIMTWFTWVKGKTFMQKARQQVLDARTRIAEFFSTHSRDEDKTNSEKVVNCFKALHRRCGSPVGIQVIVGTLVFVADSMIMLSFEFSIDKQIGYYGEQKRTFAYNPSSVLLIMWVVTPICYLVKYRLENKSKFSSWIFTTELTSRDLWRILLAGMTMGLGDLFELMAIHSAGAAIVAVATTMEIVFCLFWSQLLMKVRVVETAYYLSLMVILSNIVLLAILEEFPRTWTDFVHLNNGRGNGAAFTTHGGVMFGFILSLLAVMCRGFSYTMAEFVLASLEEEDEEEDENKDGCRGAAQTKPRASIQNRRSSLFDKLDFDDSHAAIQDVARQSIRRRSSMYHLEEVKKPSRIWQALTLLIAAEGFAIFPYIPYGYARRQPMGQHFFGGWDYRTVIFLFSLMLGQVAGSLGAWKLRAMTIEIIGLLVSVAVFVTSMVLFPPLPGSQSEDARGYFRYEAGIIIVIIFLSTLTMIRGRIYVDDEEEEVVIVSENIHPEIQNPSLDKDDVLLEVEESEIEAEESETEVMGYDSRSSQDLNVQKGCESDPV